MIETTISEVDGVRFYKNVKVLEPDDTVGGLGVHLISWRLIDRAPELIQVIKLLGLRKVGEVLPMGADQYAQFPMPYLLIRVVQFTLRTYWATIRWLYDNARFFKQIPPPELFSWRYFTPYVWYRELIKK